jgi:hypothetical protein
VATAIPADRRRPVAVVCAVRLQDLRDCPNQRHRGEVDGRASLLWRSEIQARAAIGRSGGLELIAEASDRRSCRGRHGRAAQPGAEQVPDGVMGAVRCGGISAGESGLNLGPDWGQ